MKINIMLWINVVPLLYWSCWIIFSPFFRTSWTPLHVVRQRCRGERHGRFTQQLVVLRFRRILWPSFDIPPKDNVCLSRLSRKPGEAPFLPSFSLHPPEPLSSPLLPILFSMSSLPCFFLQTPSPIPCAAHFISLSYASSVLLPPPSPPSKRQAEGTRRRHEYLKRVYSASHT